MVFTYHSLGNVTVEIWSRVESSFLCFSSCESLGNFDRGGISFDAYRMSDIHYYNLQLDGVYQKVILNLDLRLAKESLEVRTYACVYALVFRCDWTLIYIYI